MSPLSSRYDLSGAGSLESKTATDFGVDSRCGEAGMAEPSADRVEVHPRAQQMSCGRVAKQVGTNLLGG